VIIERFIYTSFCDVHDINTIIKEYTGKNNSGNYIRTIGYDIGV